jgi:hypothetical protein
MAHLRSLRANKHAETLMQTVSERFSRTTNLNIIFVCWVVTSAGKGYYGTIEQQSPFAVTVEAMWWQGIDTLAKMFSYDVAEIIRLFQATYAIRVSSTQWRTDIRTTRNLFMLLASNSTLVHLLIFLEELKCVPK